MLTTLTMVMSLLGAGAPVQLAAPGLTASGVAADRVQFISEFLATRVSLSGARVITPKELAAVLGLERQRQLAGCSESTSCLVELANAMGVEGVLIGDLANFAQRFVMTVKVLKASDGKAIFIRSVEAATEGQLLDELKRVAADLGDEVPLALGHGGGGAANFNAAVIPVVAGAAGVVVGGVLLGLAAGQRAVLLGPGPIRRTEADAAVSAGQTLQTAGLVSAGIGAGVAIAGGLWWALSRRAPAVAGYVTEGGAGVVLSWSLP